MSLQTFGPRDQDDTTAILRRETANALGYVRNQLHVRASHPTYGITKRILSSALARAEGLLVALMILDGSVNNFNTNGSPVTRYAADNFNTDLDALRAAVKGA